MSDVLKDIDAGEDPYMALRGDKLTEDDHADGIAAMIDVERPPLWLRAEQATELATFLLVAAGPDAAREALAKLAPDVMAAKDAEIARMAELMAAEHAASIRAQARAFLAEKRLAAVLALQAEDIAEAWLGVPFTRIGGLNEKMANRVLNLIHSRATEGAEAPTGATT